MSGMSLEALLQLRFVRRAGCDLNLHGAHKA
jgi:hypothetical protein